MNRLRFPLLAAIGLIVLPSAVWSAPVPGARSGLEQVPDTAPVVVHLRGIQGSRDRLVAMMQSALPDVLKKFQTEMDDFLKNGHEGRKIRGLHKDGPIFLVVTELPKADQPLNGPPPLAVVLAVTDYKEFRDNVLTEEERKGMMEKEGYQSATMTGEMTYFVDRKGYAVLTPNEDIAKTFAKGKFTGLHTKMSKELAAKLLSSDLGAYVNMDAVNKEYAENIKKAKEGIEQGIAFGAAAAGDESQKQAMEMLKKAVDPIFQAIEDMHAVLLTVEMRPAGLALHLQSELKESSATANLLQDSRPIKFDELDRLPRDRQYYLGMKASAALYKNLGGLIAGLQPAGIQDAAALMDKLAKAGPSSMLSGGSFPPAGLTVYHFDSPAKAVDAMLDSYRKMDPQAAKLKGKPDVKPDAEKYGDFKLHRVEMQMDFDKMAEAAGKGGEDAKKQYVEAMKGMLGEKTTLWFGTDGKAVVQLNAADWSAAQKLLEQYSKGDGKVGEVKAFQNIRNEMPKQTSFLALVDATHLGGTIMEVAKPMMPPGVPLPPGWPKMPGKETSSYVGVAVTLQPNRGSFDLVITSAAADEFYKAFIKPFLGE